MQKFVRAIAAVIVVSGIAGCTSSKEPKAKAEEKPSSTSTTVSLADHRDPTLCPDKPWMAPGATPAERSEELVKVLTIEQKVAQLHGDAIETDFRIVTGIPELCVPDLTVTNGPAGIGASTLPLGGPQATAVPSPLSVASSWDPTVSTKFGNLVADEMNNLGRNLLESPDVDVARTPLAGRTFEAFGEDPLLISRMANAQIDAVQAKGIIAMVKHYVGNSQEADRGVVSVDADERTMRQLYLAPFESAVRDADVASVMCAYNKVDGTYSCESKELITDILRDDWGFEGFVQSDFGATHSTVESAEAGMDLEMPADTWFGQKMTAALEAGEVSVDLIDQMLVRRFTQMFKFGLFDRKPTPSPIPVEKHGQIAREIGEAGTVLLRNEGGLLPLSDTDVKSIAVVGPASATAAVGGGGSSKVTPLREISPIDGIRERVGTDIEMVTDSSSDPAAAASVAKSADVAVVVVGAAESEGADRANLSLGAESDAL
ncbi:MAG TPA: glycoside hydrolase family 3 N-terminal domain-containing protein, partial [Microthrixaceae bacterium]|nr:glycoside hydrolase family 3 N-terminal domain-containing protein [Microthrixaceae bacterium]